MRIKVYTNHPDTFVEVVEVESYKIVDKDTVNLYFESGLQTWEQGFGENYQIKVKELD